MFRYKSYAFVIILIFFVVLAHPSKISPARQLFKSVRTISFGKSPSYILSFFKKLLPKDEKVSLLEIKETPEAMVIQEDLREQSSYLSKKQYYSEDFSISFNSSKQVQLSLSFLRDYELEANLSIWNELVKGIRLSFFGGKLFRKEIRLAFPSIGECLILLADIRDAMLREDIGEEQINYRGTNRFVWQKNDKIYIEYKFSLDKNIFNQVIGYKATLLLRSREEDDNIKIYLRRVRKNLRKLYSDF